MARERIEQEAVPVSEVWKGALGRADKALGRMSKGLRAAAFVGLIAGITTASQAKELNAIESPAVSTVEGKETSFEISAAQIPPAPEIVVRHETEKALADDFLVQIQAPEPIVPSENPQGVETVTSYEVQPGDTLTAIAKKFGLPWQVLYGKNIDIIGKNPGLIREGTVLSVPDPEKDEALIKALTPREIPESEFGIGGPEEESRRYFPETGHYISGPFLEFFNKYGLDVLGYPISEQFGEDEPVQFFQRIILRFCKVDPYKFLPERPKYDTPGPHLYPNLIGWALYFNPERESEGVPLPGEPEFPTPGKLKLAEEFKEFYQAHGGNEILGYPISGARWENGVLVQWLLHTRLEYRPDNPDPYKVQLGLLGQEYIDAFIKNKNFLEPQPPPEEKPPTQIEILNSFARENPEKLRELQAQAVGAVAYQINGGQSSFGDWTQERDYTVVSYHRFDKLVGSEMDERPFDYQTALMALAWHEERYKENPVVRQVLEEAVPGTKAINKLLVNKLSPELFKENQVPQLPENIQEMLEKIVFTGTGGRKFLRGGQADSDFFTLFGRYDLLEQENPQDIEEARKALPQNGWHELIHSLVQTKSKEQGTPWWEWKGLLWHKSMGTIEVVGEETIGLEPYIDPRIVYIYIRLRNAGVEDPYGLLVRTAVTANEKRLLEIYERIRGAGDLSMDKLLATNDPDPNFTYYTPKELERFKEEYQSYIR